MSENNISRRKFLGHTAAAVGALGLAQLPLNALATTDTTGLTPQARGKEAGLPDEAGLPNIVFILTDDLGWGDLSIYGRREYKTPNIDKLAKQGVRLTQAYSNSSVCTPTRIAFLTGRYQQRTLVGLQEPLNFRKQLEQNGTVDRLGLSPDHPTVASLLRAGGYRTALVGKWHAGYLPTFSPLKSGFDEFFGIFSGGVDYFTHNDGNGEPDLWEDDTPVEKTGYITDLITNRAVKYINREARARRRFFLSLNYTAPHWPWEGPQDEAISRNLGSLFHLDGGSLEIYAQIVKRLDVGIGKVLKTLEQNGLADNTLVVFTSDNGGERFSDLWPFIGSKGGVYEGSQRVPAILRWPGQLPAGQVSHQVAATFDWTATLLAAGGVTADPAYPLDGIDLLPYLATAGNDEATVSRDLFWRIGGQRAARSGDLKYIKLARPDQVVTQGGLPAALRGTEFLFDLSRDVREQANLLNARPEDAERLRQLWDSWNASVLAEGTTA